MSIYISPDIFPIAAGIVPVNELFDRSRNCNDRRLLKAAGIVPFMLLFDIYKDLSETRPESSLAIVPINLLFWSRRLTNRFKVLR